jgi:hypothetical protein
MGRRGPIHVESVRNGTRLPQRLPVGRAWPICAALTELSHIGVGRTLTATDVLLLVHNRLVRVIHATTGELLRELTIDPARDHQPTGRPPGPAPKTQ